MSAARENTSYQVVISFSFVFDWSRGWRGFSEPIKEGSKVKPEQSRMYTRHSIKSAPSVLCLQHSGHFPSVRTSKRNSDPVND